MVLDSVTPATNIGNAAGRTTGRFGLVMVLVGAIWVAPSLSAAQTTGALRGDVADTSGAALPGVTIELMSPVLLGGVRTVVSDERGTYRFPGLAPGTYAVEASLPGFQSQRREGVRVEVGAQYDINFVLPVSTLEESVIVTGSAPTIDNTRSAMATTFSKELLEAVPSGRFFFFDVAYQAPGIGLTRHNNTNFRAVAFGSSVNENMFLLDGLDVTATHSGAAWTYPGQDMVEEMVVIGLGASAEYGNFQGGVFNLVTKSGTERYRGTAGLFWQGQALTGENARINNIPFHRERFYDFSLTSGGPLLTDRLRYFGYFQYRDDAFSEPGVNPETPAEQSNKNYFVKVNARLNTRNDLVGSFYTDPGTIPGQINVSNPFETVTAEVNTNYIPVVAWTSVLDERSVLDVRYAGFYGNNYSKMFSGNNTTPGHRDVATGVASVNADNWYDGDYWRTQVHATLSRYVPAAIGGSHDLRVGVTVQNGGSSAARGFPGGRYYSDRNGLPERLQIQNPSISAAELRGGAAFISDSWSMGNRVTFSPGLRFDRSVGIVPDVDILGADGTPTGERVSNPGEVWTFNVWSPRIGLNVTLDDAARTVARAHFGRYYQGLNTSLIQPLSLANSPRTEALWNGTEFVPQFTVDTNQTNRSIDPDLRTPHSDQFSIGLDHELASSLSLGVTFVYKKWRDLTGYERLGASYSTVTRTYTDLRGGSPRVMTIELENQLNDPSQDRLNLTNRSIFTQNYKGVVLTANKRMSNHWMVLGSYTWSVSKGLTAGSNATDPYERQTSVSNWGTDPNELRNATGFMIDDRPHMFKVQYAVNVPWDFQVSGNLELLAGKPIFPRAVMGLSQGNISVFVDPKDGDILRAPSIRLFSVRVTKTIRLPGQRGLRLAADVLNLFNDDAFYSVRATQVTSAVFGEGSTFIPPRRMILSANLDW